jgi:hAT family C-terminal dimerisation region
MARDYLAIQGSATPSERAFSNASLTDTKQRNRLMPEAFEALQILKGAYRNGHMSTMAAAERYFQSLMSMEENQDRDTENVIEIL